MYDLVEMMTYKRPQGSDTQKEFCYKYLEPIMGLPDKYGNYVLTVGNKPQVCFTAHHDTVHKTSQTETSSDKRWCSITQEKE